MECFESVFPAIFLSYAPTFFRTMHSWVKGIQIGKGFKFVPMKNHSILKKKSRKLVFFLLINVKKKSYELFSLVSGVVNGPLVVECF